MDEQDRGRHLRDSLPVLRQDPGGDEPQPSLQRTWLPPARAPVRRAGMPGHPGRADPATGGRPMDWAKGWAATSPEYFRLAMHDDILDLVTDLLGDDVASVGRLSVEPEAWRGSPMAHGHRVVLTRGRDRRRVDRPGEHQPALFTQGGSLLAPVRGAAAAGRPAERRRPGEADRRARGGMGERTRRSKRGGGRGGARWRRHACSTAAFGTGRRTSIRTAGAIRCAAPVCDAADADTHPGSQPSRVALRVLSSPVGALHPGERERRRRPQSPRRRPGW